MRLDIGGKTHQIFAAAAVSANQVATRWKFRKAQLIAVYACGGTRRCRSEEDAEQLQRRRSDSESEGTH